MRWDRNEPVMARFDDDRFGGGGGDAPLFALDERLSVILRSHFGSYRPGRRLLAFLIAHPSSKTFTEQVLPLLDYWHFRSGARFDFMCLGHSAKGTQFDDELFAASVQWLRGRTAWEYAGGTDLVLLNATLPPGSNTLTLETEQVVSIALEQAMADQVVLSLPELMERVFSFVEDYKGDDPTWGFSNQQGKHLVASGLKALLVGWLPTSLRPEARKAFHLYVREHVRAAA